MPTSEDVARLKIDAYLELAGWIVQDAGAANIHSGRGWSSATSEQSARPWPA